MMKIRYVFMMIAGSVLMAGLLLTSCKPSPGRAETYFYRILDCEIAVLAKEDALNLIITREMQKTLADSANGNITYHRDTITRTNELNNAYEEFCRQIDQSRASLDQMSPLAGDRKLLDAAISLMKTYQEISGKEYKEIIEIVKIPSSIYSNEDDNRFLDLTEHIDTCLQGEIDQFTRVSKEFAFKYKFQIVEEKLNNH